MASWHLFQINIPSLLSPSGEPAPHLPRSEEAERTEAVPCGAPESLSRRETATGDALTLRHCGPSNSVTGDFRIKQQTLPVFSVRKKEVRVK